MPHSSTVLARFPIFALNCAEELGLDRGEVLRAAGVARSELRDPDARIKLRQSMSIWREILGSSQDPGLGVRLGSRLRVTDVGLIGYLMAYSPNLHQALDRLTRFSRILDTAYPFSLRIEGDLAAFSTEPMPEERLVLRRMADLNAAAFVAVVREITGSDVVPAAIHLPYAEPPSDQSTHRAYFRCPLKFDQPLLEIVLRRRNLDLPIVEAEEEVGHYLESHAAEVLRSLAPDGTFAERVERALWSGMKDGELSLEAAAKRLAVGPRTLQRRLREEAKSFADVRDSLRREMAISLLEKRELAVYEVAHLLGYSEPSTFHRAFRRWTDSSPHQYRQQR